LHDLFIDDSYISTKYIKTLVLDEADMLLEQGFADLVDSFMQKLEKPQILVFSATINQSLQYILEKYIASDFVITSDSDNMTSKNVTHYALDIKHREITAAVDKFIASKPCFCMMIFCSKKNWYNQYTLTSRKTDFLLHTLPVIYQNKKEKMSLKLLI
jgi:superfamily II DNA/RNA helicase